MTQKKVPAPSKGLADWNPNDLIDRTGRHPSFHFEWKEPGKKKGEKIPPQRRKKRRALFTPNREMVQLQKLFKMHLDNAIEMMDGGGKETYPIRQFPSATGSVRGSNHFKNAQLHSESKFFYIVDFKDAYPSLDLRKLTMLLVFIFRYELYRDVYSIKQFGRNSLAHYAMETDPMFPIWESFVKFTFGGQYGQGLAVGGTLSPYLINLYCEVFLDSRIRDYCEKRADARDPNRKIHYTRYVDDLVFSSNTFMSFERRGEFRRMIKEAGFRVNHRKAFVSCKENGTVFITKVGLEDQSNSSRLVFPKRKRCRLEGLIKSYLTESLHNDNPELITGMAAEFLHYYSLAYPENLEKPVEKTQSDKRTFALCKKFEKAAAPYLSALRYARAHGSEEKLEHRERERHLKRVLKRRARP